MTDSATFSIAGAFSVTPLQVRNRKRADDAFGLLCIVGWVVGEALLENSIIHVRVAGLTRAIPANEAMGTLHEGARMIEVNIMTHLIPDGPQFVEIEVEAQDGSRVAFQPIAMEVSNDSTLAKQVAADLRAYGSPTIIGRHVDSTMFPYDGGDARAWFEDDIDNGEPLTFEPSVDSEAAERHLQRWGFCILPETLPQVMIDAFKADLDKAIDSGDLAYRRGSSDRIHGAHEKLQSARDIWLYPPVLAFLKKHFRDTPCACQTLTYVNGSEQGAHQDTIHLTPYPAGYMSGVWIALQDVQEGSGELFVYPGSHLNARLRTAGLGISKVENNDYSHFGPFDQAVQDLLAAGGYERVVYRPKAGQILVWHENLAHGGSPRLHQDRERISVVSHYFARGAVGYYDARGEAAGLEALPEMK